MRTDLTINEVLLDRALLMGGLMTKNEIVNLALEEFIEKRTREEVISLFNTVGYDADYDYKKLRGGK